MNTRSLIERRTALVAEMRTLTNSPAGNGGDLSAEQATKFDSLKADLESTERNIARQQVLDDAERRSTGTALNATGDERFDAACSKFSLRVAIAAAAGLTVDAGREREIGAELARRSGRQFQGIAVPMAVFNVERRTLTSQFASPDSGGANLVPTDQRPDLYIDALRAKMVVRRLGARVLSGLHGNIEIPKLSTSASSSWIADDTALSSGDPTFAKVSLTPNTCGALTEFSRNLLLQSSPDVETLIRADFAGVLANALDIAALGGAGGSELGILNLSALPTVAGPITWAKILEMIETVEEANGEGTGWTTTPGMKRLLRATQKVAGGTDATMVMESAKGLAGYPLASTTNIPATLGSPAESDALIFGDFGDLLIGLWSELDILVNPYETGAYSRGGVKVRGMMTADVVARHTPSFCAMINVSPG